MITQLETETGKHITNETLILLGIESFYNNLYSSETTATLNEYLQFTNNLEIPQLTEDMSDKLEGPLTYEECNEALSSFSRGKSPGEDGFTAEFYIKFFDILGEDLVRSLNHAYEKGELSISQHRGVITLLPKDESLLLDLKNWHLITLLNVDYKKQQKQWH